MKSKSPISISVLIPASLVGVVILSLIIKSLGSGWSGLQVIIQAFFSSETLNSLSLSTSVGLLSLFLGVFAARLICFYEFPGRKIWEWVLILPMALPAYVMAFSYVSLLDYSGPIPTWLRHLGWNAFPEIRSFPGLILVMSLTLYPYIYLLARNAFLSQGQAQIEVARSLGLRPQQAFWKVVMPSSLTWLIAGLGLVMMEVMADFGAVSVFQYNTLTTAIYDAWKGEFSLTKAAQISLILLVFVMSFLGLEKKRVQDEGIQDSGHLQRGYAHRIALSPLKIIFSHFGLASLGLMAFFIPLSQLGYWSYQALGRSDHHLLDLISKSLVLGILGGLLLVTVGLGLSYGLRIIPNRKNFWLSRIALLGYSLPGTLLAIALFIPLSFVDHQFTGLMEKLFQRPLPLLLSGTIVIMLLGYTIRFLALPFRSLNSAFGNIPTAMDEVSLILGVRGWKRFWKIYWPLLRGGILTAILFGLVEILKEMPLTLMTRPFGWNTLSVRIYEMTSEGEWALAAIPSLTLVVVGMIPVWGVIRLSGRRDKGVNN